MSLILNTPPQAQVGSVSDGIQNPLRLAFRSPRRLTFMRSCGIHVPACVVHSCEICAYVSHIVVDYVLFFFVFLIIPSCIVNGDDIYVVELINVLLVVLVLLLPMEATRNQRIP